MIFFLYPCTDYQDMQNKEVPKRFTMQIIFMILALSKTENREISPKGFLLVVNKCQTEGTFFHKYCLHPKVGIFSSKYQKKKVKSNLVFEKFVFMVSYLIFSVTLFFKISKKKNYMYVTCMPTMLGVEYGLFNF